MSSLREGILIPVDRIRIDYALQTRVSLDAEVIEQWTERMRGGDQFPSIVVFEDATDPGWYVLSDGFHRLGAAKGAELTSIRANVHSGTKRDALLYAVGANDAHGLRRTNEGKRRSVSLLLADPEWGQASDRWIADACRVSYTLVVSVRKGESGNSGETSTTGDSSSSGDSGETSTTATNRSSKRRGKDGKARRKPRSRGGLCARCTRIGVATCEKCKAKAAEGASTADKGNGKPADASECTPHRCPSCGHKWEGGCSPERLPKKPGGKFVPPTVEEVTAYCHERGDKVNPQQWHDHYTANGWMVGKTKMVDWKAAVRKWETSDFRINGKPAPHKETEAEKKARHAKMAAEAKGRK